MKHYLLVILALFLFVACSSDHDDVVPDEIPEDVPEMEFSFSLAESDSVLLGDSIKHPFQEGKSRSWNNTPTVSDMYLVSDLYGERNSLKIRYVKGNYPVVKFSLSVSGGKIYASYNRKRIPITGACVLSTVPSCIAENYRNRNYKTPAGQPAYEPFDDKLFRSMPFEIRYERNSFWDRNSYFVIDYDGTTYANNNNDGYFYSDWNDVIFIDLNRYTTKVRANFVIIDYDIFILGGIMTKDAFEDETDTNMEDWEFQTFMKGATETYDALRETSSGKYQKGDKIVALTSSKETFRERQITWLQGALVYGGIGRVYDGEQGCAFVLPHSTKDAKLCYSFFYKRANKRSSWREFNTLEVPISNLSLDPNVHNDVTIFFYVDDLKKAMKKSFKPRSAGICREDPDFGTVMDIPYQVKVSYK